MSEIILIYIHHKEESICVVPQGTLYLGTHLQNHGFSIKVFNFMIDKDKKLDDNDLKELKKELEDCICVGLSVMTLQVPKSLKLTTLIKSIKPKVNIVWGGTHPTLFPEQTLQNKNIDFVIKGEGEKPLLELAQALKSKRNKFEKINGLVFKKMDKIIQNPQQELFDEFEKMIPNWNLISEFTKKSMEIFVNGNLYRLIEVHTGRGCPYRCTFCINETFFGKSRRFKPINVIIKEIKILIEKFSPTLIKMRDENFFINKRKVEEFCDALKKENINIKWTASCRVNYFDNFDDEFLQKVKDSGCIALSFGAESGSQKCLDYLKKDITPAQIYNAASKCVKYDIFPVFSFMTGLPIEKKEDLLQTLNLIRRIKKISNKVGFTDLQILRPYPGGELYKECLSFGLDEPKTLEDWEKADKDYFTPYLNAKYLLWIKDPEAVETIAKYVPKGSNNYIASLNVNPVWKILFKIRANLFDKLTYKFVETDSKIKKRILKSGLQLIDNTSKIGKFIFTNTVKRFKNV